MPVQSEVLLREFELWGKNKILLSNLANIVNQNLIMFYSIKQNIGVPEERIRFGSGSASEWLLMLRQRCSPKNPRKPRNSG